MKLIEKLLSEFERNEQQQKEIERHPMTKVEFGAAYRWIHAGDNRTLLRPEIAEKYEPYRLAKPTRLYQGRRPDRGVGFSTWTKSFDVAKRMAGQDGEVVSAVFKPEETIVDFELVQRKRGWNDEFITAELEVVVNPSVNPKITIEKQAGLRC